MNKKILSVLCVCTLMLAITMPSHAATGYQGYAAYRNGVGNIGGVQFLDEWHGAIMIEKDENENIPVAQSESPSNGTELATWDDFLDGFVALAYYKPIPNMTNTRRDAVVATARELAASNIEYTILNQMTYDNGYNPNGKTIVNASDIYEIRCDGFVEYCYEFNSIRIFGTNTLWNISKWGFDYMSAHGGINITPKTQAQDYMVRVAGIGY